MTAESDEMIDVKGKGRMEDVVRNQMGKNDQLLHSSVSFHCPSSNLILQHQLPHYALPRFQLLIRQDPIKGFATGTDVTARKNARITPLDPPPVCELIVLPFGEEDEMDEVERARFLSTVEVCIHVRLVSVDDPQTEIQDRNLDPNGVLLVGNTVESPFIAPCTSPFLKDECFFIFSELSVRCSGQYRLRYDLIDRANNRFQKIASVVGNPFTVYSQKKYYGNFTESSSLIKDIAARGLRLRICKGNQDDDECVQEKKQSKKKRKTSDVNVLQTATKVSFSRPRAISDSVNRSLSSNNQFSPASAFFVHSTEKPNLPPLSSSSSSSSRSLHRKDGASEGFYPFPSGMTSAAEPRFEPSSNAPMPSSIYIRFSQRAGDSKKEQSVMDWRGNEDDAWHARRTLSYTPSSYLHDQRQADNGYYRSEIQDQKLVGRNDYRPSIIGDRYHLSELGWHNPHMRSVPIRSNSYQSSIIRNDVESIKAERWQEVPILPPIRRQSDSRPMDLDRHQRRTSRDFQDDIDQYAFSRRYEAKPS
ncbi:uncharacterized protein FA14DRAFT_22693 [Meira miltonrushii]|uniref:Velvet domain-containing protein n=1 Tax=Meira miltonrushii TaxID=1280837 RepID=A0A316VPJ1_9BASI|nr:uncharacterized protein FA14DRAFT_22693 [Meira miltonrushii]PWN38071.1 hypothetical protein FA14DRAFT_22693 [Meira miltonrushii]